MTTDVKALIERLREYQDSWAESIKSMDSNSDNGIMSVIRAEQYETFKQAADALADLLRERDEALGDANETQNDLHERNRELWAMRTRAEFAEAELAKLRADGERYRWLRDIGDSTWDPMSKRGITADECDAAIDAAKGAGHD